MDIFLKLQMGAGYSAVVLSELPNYILDVLHLTLQFMNDSLCGCYLWLTDMHVARRFNWDMVLQLTSHIIAEQEARQLIILPC